MKITFHDCFPITALSTCSEELSPTLVFKAFVSDPIWKHVPKSHCYWIKEHCIAPAHSVFFLWKSEKRGSWVPGIIYECLFPEG